MSRVDPSVVATIGRAPAGERDALLCFVAGQSVALPADELNGALRRAELLLVAGGDPRRKLEPDGRAVTALADDLDTAERRQALIAALHEIGITEAHRLAGDPERAWRYFALTLLAAALDGD